MTKRFCVSTKGLTKEQRQSFATDLNKFVQEKKSQFETESREEESED